VTLKDGRVLTTRVDSFKGTPEQPLSRAEMREKFLLLTRHCDGQAMARLFERLQGIEDEKSLDWVKVDAAKKTIAKPVKRAAARRKQPKRIKAK
jgi:2-methylcitrate dehydratase PrpD